MKNSDKLMYCAVALNVFKKHEEVAICICGCKKNEFSNSDIYVCKYMCENCKRNYSFDQFFTRIKEVSQKKTQSHIYRTIENM